VAYAAKTVFSVAFLTACGTNGDGSDNASEGAVTSSLSPACRGGLPKLQSAFPEGDHEWWDMRADPALVGQADVTACCKEILVGTESHGESIDALLVGTGKFRNVGCCKADYHIASDAGPVDAGPSGFNGPGIACTPWGPPVPPAMAWSAVA